MPGKVKGRFMSSRFLDNWAVQIRKGLLDLFVLNAIAGRRMYGYDIVRLMSGMGALVLSEGTIYPLLSRLSHEGLIRGSLEESREGPARKYYELTPAGQQTLATMNDVWTSIMRGSALIAKPQSPPQPPPQSQPQSQENAP